MNKSFFIINVVLLACLLSCVSGKKEERGNIKIQNPLDVAFGDPFVLKASDGKYYMYGTGGVKDGFRAYVSTDLANWEELGRVTMAVLPKPVKKGWYLSIKWKLCPMVNWLFTDLQ